MRKVATTLLLVALVVGLCGEAWAASPTGVYIRPTPNIFADIPHRYNLIGTLRLAFPDKVWEDNLSTIENLIAGKQETLYMPLEKKGFRYYEGVRLYLLPKQMIVYQDFFMNAGMTDPLWSRVADATIGKDYTHGQGEIFGIIAERLNPNAFVLR